MSNNRTLNESLSALMDSEVDDLELRRILKALSENDANQEDFATSKDLQDTWERYHLLSASLNQEVHSQLPVNILAGVKAQISNEETPSKASSLQATPQKTSIYTRLSQGAIAATVALGVLVVSNFVNNPESANSDTGVEMASVNQQGSFPSTLVFNGDYTASEFSRTASTNGDTSSHLTQAVYSEFEPAAGDQVIVIPLRWKVEDQGQVQVQVQESSRLIK